MHFSLRPLRHGYTDEKTSSEKRENKADKNNIKPVFPAFILLHAQIIKSSTKLLSQATLLLVYRVTFMIKRNLIILFYIYIY